MEREDFDKIEVGDKIFSTEDLCWEPHWGTCRAFVSPVNEIEGIVLLKGLEFICTYINPETRSKSLTTTLFNTMSITFCVPVYDQDDLGLSGAYKNPYMGNRTIIKNLEMKPKEKLNNRYFMLKSQKV